MFVFAIFRAYHGVAVGWRGTVDATARARGVGRNFWMLVRTSSGVIGKPRTFLAFSFKAGSGQRAALIMKE